MSKLSNSGYIQHSLIEKIGFLSFLDSIKISDELFKQFNLIPPIFDRTEIRVRCFKCSQRRNYCKPRVYKHCKGLLTHLYSPNHKIDANEFPTLNQSVKLAYLVSFMAQKKLLGEKI